MTSQENMKQSRREFLMGAAMAGAATVAAGCMSGRPCACTSMAGFTVKPMKRIRVAMVAVGARGTWSATTSRILATQRSTGTP